MCLIIILIKINKRLPLKKTIVFITLFFVFFLPVRVFITYINKKIHTYVYNVLEELVNR